MAKVTAKEAAPRAAAAAPGLWKRYLASYYVCNTIALLVYLPIRARYSSEELQSRDNYLGIPLEHEIFLLAALSFVVNYRKKATSDGVVALFFLYGKIGVLAALFYLDATLFGWYLAYCVVLFTGVGQPAYSGPSKVKELTPALVEQLIKKGKQPTAKHWLVFFYTPWSDYCLEHDAMIAELSLTYSSAELAFGRVDLNQWTDLAVEYNIDTSATSWQLPTLILFRDGKEAVRLPQFDDKGNIRKTVLHRVGLVAVFKLQELKDGKKVEFKAKSS